MSLHSVHHSLHPRTPRVTPEQAITRFEKLRDDLIKLEHDLHEEDLPTERDHAEDAAEHCDYAIDTLKMLARGADPL